MASIFDVFGRLLLEGDGKEFVASARKVGGLAGDAAGQSMGQRVTGALKASVGPGLKVMAGTAATLFGVASKGALELADASARYRAETGATQQQADEAIRAANATAGAQRQSLDSVLAASIKVRKDLGLTGAAASEMTDSFVRFARVTRQDASAAVSDFDDILDSWGLSASDANDLMNQLLVSNQRFGGSIEETQKTLASLAPSFKAANFQIGDAIELLNLFGAKGLDANTASAAFAKALTKVKSPAELKALIKDISNTTDPFERASKAADLFGARAGAKLGNALGGANLDDYAVSAEDAAGATQKAADALDSTFTAQLQKKISEAGAALKQFGADVGPAVTGLASLASLGAGLGIDKVFTRLLKGLAGSAAIKAASRSVGITIATAMLGGKAIGAGLEKALVGALDALPGSSAIKGAAGRVGKLLGGGLGTALSVAFAAVAVVEVINTYNRIKGDLAKQGEQIGHDVANEVATGTLDELQQSKAALQEGIDKLGGVLDFGLFSNDARANLQKQLDAVNAAIDAKSKGIPTTVADNLAAGQPKVTAGADDMTDGIDDSVDAAGKAAGKAAAKTPIEIADGLRSDRNSIDQAMSQLNDDIKNSLTRTQEAAKLAGQLTSKELAAGLKSHDPVVRAQAEATKQLIVDRLQALADSSGTLGKKAGAELQAGLKSKDPVIRAAAQQAQKAIEAKWNAIKGRKAGQAAGENLRAGVLDKETRIGLAAWTVGTKIARNLLGGILYGGGGRASKDDTATAPGKAIGGRVAANRPYIVGERRPELFVPDVPGTVLPRVPAASTPAAAPTTVIYQLTANVEGIVPVRSELDIARELGRAARFGKLTPMAATTANRPAKATA